MFIIMSENGKFDAFVDIRANILPKGIIIGSSYAIMKMTRKMTGKSCESVDQSYQTCFFLFSIREETRGICSLKQKRCTVNISNFDHGKRTCCACTK